MNGKATKTKTLFKMEISVAINITAQPERVWSLLTDAQRFPTWNSTIQSIEGTIAAGQTIQLKNTLSPERTFKLKITQFEPHQSMVWQDGNPPMFSGVRRFTLTKKSDGTTDFAMVETFAGLMMPMIAGALPDFIPSFERYAADLKAAAEK